ncbi:MAG TPA: U32 family peptidase [Leucothrix mucor]|nr:U32 family peptidase [Leucothrix mucor]
MTPVTSTTVETEFPIRKLSTSTQHHNIELLAPGGDAEAIKGAIVAGASAVYCGLEGAFNARNRATNLSFDELTGVLRLAHHYNCEVFLTINVVILEPEMPALFKLLNRLVNTRIDGIIVQDLGLFNLVKHYFPSFNLHASTQLTTVNEGQLAFLAKIGASRVNLSRELNIDEIKTLTAVAHQHNLLTEVFVHGALCIAFSGQCYSSSVSVGNSGNRGRCSQACRDEYETTAAGKNFPLNLKDNSAYFDLPALVDAEVDSLKIEGRIKGAHYVYTVVDSWRKQINRFVETGRLLDNDKNLRRVFNRDFTNSFLNANLSKDMFIDNPRDHGVRHSIKENDAITDVQIEAVTSEFYADKDALGATLRHKIKNLSIDKRKLSMSFSGQQGEPLSLKVSIDDPTNNSSINTKEDSDTIIIQSESLLNIAGKKGLDHATFERRFKNLRSDCMIDSFDYSQLGENLVIPFSELTKIKNKLSFWLNDSVEIIEPVEVPRLRKHPKINQQATLSLLISEEKDLHLCDTTDADIYFKLPESFKKDSPKFIELLKNHPRLIPWFPAVLIGKDYDEAVRILQQVKPTRIVTNNTGIAYKAFEMNIEWIAGPFLNTTNSYALRTLKENLNCAGAFISNEINRKQIKNIRRPENFKMLYSIYHPILMMTSRQCFFQQTVGCNKPTIEDGCMLKCKKATTITNVKGVSFAIDKQRGGYPSIYNDEQFLNTNIVHDFSDLFDEFFIDLTDIGAGSKAELDKVQLIKYFEELVRKKDDEAEFSLHGMVIKSTQQQYTQGL